MREILFRGKRVDNGEWVYGWYVFADVDVGFKEQKYYILTQDEYGFSWYEVVPETVGQYTGLRDKNGTRIFEGDIVRITNEFTCQEFIGCVEFDVFGMLMASRACKEKGQKDCASISGAMVNSWTCVVVIGNIHDNPELLEYKQ